jgi:hypothetical protein
MAVPAAGRDGFKKKAAGRGAKAVVSHGAETGLDSSLTKLARGSPSQSPVAHAEILSLGHAEHREHTALLADPLVLKKEIRARQRCQRNPVKLAAE